MPAAFGEPRIQARAWCLLWSWAMAWSLVHAWHAGGSWHWFTQGSQVLFDDDPGTNLHLYARHPELQIGPLAFVVAAPMLLFQAGTARVVAIALMSTSGLVLLAGLWALVPPRRRSEARLLWAGATLLPVWAELATRAGHLDDVLALAFAVAAMRALVRGHPLLTGVFLAAAVDSKPWALAFAPMLLALPWRQWWKAAVVLVTGVLAAWLPFLLADPNTMAAARFTIRTSAFSGLRAMGFTDPATPPWDRPVQLLLGGVLGTLAVFRGRWPAVILLATGARILLDPKTYGYYTSGVLLGALAYDLMCGRSQWPRLTCLGLIMLYLPQVFPPAGNPFPPQLAGMLRVMYVAIAAGVVLLSPRRPDAERDKATDTTPTPRVPAPAS
ncbi:hypothetical protein J4573_39460 [Actinomadura barringtoniae]|uniref:Uncharacterized protein n=1 Tax=Actinomadura barringtoniae TaxID=1427535 RepID=A0A939PJ44_9ACTN|nr:hypothetical protein [Actinomadura barringtoniae]MBO2453227.1 hypothetical protein [Actinomadura barringtoniae]